MSMKARRRSFLLHAPQRGRLGETWFRSSQRRPRGRPFFRRGFPVGIQKRRRAISSAPLRRAMSARCGVPSRKERSVPEGSTPLQFLRRGRGTGCSRVHSPCEAGLVREDRLRDRGICGRERVPSPFRVSCPLRISMRGPVPAECRRALRRTRAAALPGPSEAAVRAAAADRGRTRSGRGRRKTGRPSARGDVPRSRGVLQEYSMGRLRSISAPSLAAKPWGTRNGASSLV